MDVLAVLGRPARAEDVVPPELLAGSPGGGTGPWAAARRLPDMAEGQAWVTYDAQAGVCFLFVPERTSRGPTSCHSLVWFQEAGLSLVADRSDGSVVTVLLVPDGWEAAPGSGAEGVQDQLGTTSADRVGPNVLVADGAPRGP